MLESPDLAIFVLTDDRRAELIALLLAHARRVIN